jgi:hypothetical protein
MHPSMSFPSFNLPVPNKKHSPILLNLTDRVTKESSNELVNLTERFQMERKFTLSALKEKY